LEAKPSLRPARNILRHRAIDGGGSETGCTARSREHTIRFVVCRTRKDAPKRLPAEEAARRRNGLGDRRKPLDPRARRRAVSDGSAPKPMEHRPAARFLFTEERGRFEIRHAGLSTAGRPRSTDGRAHRPGWSKDRVVRRSARFQTPKRQSVSAVLVRRRLSSNEEQTARPLRGSDRFSSQAATLVRAPKLPE